MSTTHEGRTFDWHPPTPDPRDAAYLVRDLLAPPETGPNATLPTAYDHVQDIRIAALEAAVRSAVARIKVLEGEVTPTPPSPAPSPTPPPSPAPTPSPTPSPTPGPALIPKPTVLANGDLLWTPGPILDQGQTGECVGYGSTDALASQPYPMPGIHDPATPGSDASTPGLIYSTAQRIEGDVPDDQSGTTVHAGMAACKQLGYIAAYRWALTLIDIIDSVQKLGPVVLGIPWTADMMDVDSLGFVRATGNVVGGHCICAVGVAHDLSYVILQQSWGASWGREGLCYVSAHDLGWLFAQQGEAAVPTKIVA